MSVLETSPFFSLITLKNNKGIQCTDGCNNFDFRVKWYSIRLYLLALLEFLLYVICAGVKSSSVTHGWFRYVPLSPSLIPIRSALSPSRWRERNVSESTVGYRRWCQIRFHFKWCSCRLTVIRRVSFRSVRVYPEVLIGFVFLSL